MGADYTITSGGTSTDESMTLKWLTTGSRTVTVNYTSNGCAAASPASKNLTVIANAIISGQPVDPASICSGAGVVSMSISTIGAISAYQWQVSTNAGSTWSDISNSAPYSNVTTATMTVTNPPSGLNNAQYHCLATGTCGILTSNAATLTVNDPGAPTGTAAQSFCAIDNPNVNDLVVTGT